MAHSRTITITIKTPFDSHVHLRRGSTLRAAARYTAERFGRGIIMPNTEPPIETIDQAIEYKNEILAAIPVDNEFEPLMTLYLTRNLTSKTIERGARGGQGIKIFGVKYYPWGATTNSQWGHRNILDAANVFRAMEDAEVPLLVHGEVHVNKQCRRGRPLRRGSNIRKRSIAACIGPVSTT